MKIPEMKTEDVVEFVRLLEARGIEVFIDGADAVEFVTISSDWSYNLNRAI